MIYKTDDDTEDWRSDRFSYQDPNDSFLRLSKKNPPILPEIEITEIFMQAFNPVGFNFKDGVMTISSQLEDLFNVLYYKKDISGNVVNVIRNSPILPFIYDYLDFVIRFYGNKDNYGVQIMLPCMLIGIFLENHIFLPIEIASTPIIKTLCMFAKSERDVEQIAGVDALSFMIQPNCPLPEYVVRKFLPLVLSFRTSFKTNSARLGCLYFIHDLFKYIKDIPIEKFAEANEEFYYAFTDKKHRYKELYSSILDCIRMEILYYPQSFQMLLERNLIQIANLLLCSNRSEVVVSANRLFSVIFTTKEYDLSPLSKELKYSSILTSCGNEIELNVQESALWLLIDISTRGPIFIEQILNRDTLKFLNDIFESQDIGPKKLFIKLVTNFLYHSSPDQEVHIITSPLTEKACSEIQIFDERDIYKFLMAIQIALQKLSKTSMYFQVKQRLLQTTFFQSLIELDSSEFEILVNLSRSIITILQSDD